MAIFYHFDNLITELVLRDKAFSDERRRGDSDGHKTCHVDINPGLE